MYIITHGSSSVNVQTYIISYKVSQYMHDGVDELDDGNCRDALHEGEE